MTKATFKAKAEAAFRRANPDATSVKITWTFVSDINPYRRGTGSFRSGHFHVENPGFRTRIMIVTCDTDTGAFTVR